MKKLLVIILLHLCLLPLRAAEEVEVKIPENSFSILLPDTAPYVAFLVDQSPSVIDKQLRVKVASLEDGQGVWSKRFYPGRIVKASDHGVIIEEAFETKLYDYLSGKELRTMNYQPIVFDTSADIILGVRGKRNKLVGSVGSTGEKLWEKKIEKTSEEAWDIICRPDSQTVIYQSDNLYKLNLLTGDVSCYDLKPYENTKIKISPFSVLLGVATAFVSPVVIFDYSIDYVRGLGSSAVVDGDHFYLSDRDKIVCLDMDFNERWLTPLPKGSGGNAVLTLDADTVRMLNFGYVTGGGQCVKSGKAFRAAFDRNTGECFGWEMFPEKFDKETFGDNLTFVADTLFRFDEPTGRYVSVKAPLGSEAVLSATGDVLFVESTLEQTGSCPAAEVWYQHSALPEGSILFRQNPDGTPAQFIRIASDGSLVETYAPDTRDIIVKGNRLFRTTPKALYVSNLWDF